MSKKADSDYLNKTAAIIVLALGTILITGTNLGAPAAPGFFILGMLLLLHGAGRLHVWNRGGTK